MGADGSLQQEISFTYRKFHFYLYITGSMSIFSNNSSRIITAVPTAAIVIIKFRVLTLLLNSFSIALNIINYYCPTNI